MMYKPVFSTPERRPSDIKDSDVYKMCKDMDAQGKPIGEASNQLDYEGDQSNASVSLQRDRESISRDRDPLSRDRESISSQDRAFIPGASRGQGLSFRVLQWLTDTVDDEDENVDDESRSSNPPYCSSHVPHASS